MGITAQHLGSFHDAELAVLAIDHPGNRAELIFNRVDGSRAGFVFEEVRTLCASDLRLQNVVSRILIFSAGGIAAQEAALLVRSSLSVDGLLHASEAILEDTLDRIEKGSLELFHVDSSAGVDVTIICGLVLPIPHGPAAIGDAR